MREHGVYSTYTKGGCRCDLCREANRDYQRARNWGAPRRYVPPKPSAPSKPQAIRTYGEPWDSRIAAAADAAAPMGRGPDKRTRA